MSVAAKIQDYAAIGNGRSIALISRFGSIDWLCWPRFDSASIFAAILDPNIGGCWRIQPTDQSEITRRYIEDTNVLETRFRTASGTVVLTDFMPVTSEEEKSRHLWPEHEIIRLLRCEHGQVRLEIELLPRPNYARMGVRLIDAGALGLRLEIGTNLLIFRSEVHLTVEDQSRIKGTIVMNAGESVSFSLSFATESPAVIPSLRDLVDEKLQVTVTWWRKWVAQSNYDGEYERQVTRSALLLKLLCYAPSGAIIAAPTASLPESLGGDHNWDYRFAWLRDASFTVWALFGLGYEEDAEAFVNWLLHATRLTRPELRVMYDVFGERPRKEEVLEHLAGYRDSKPVRIGNGARDQFQLDIYGEIVESVVHFLGRRVRLDGEVQKILRQCGQYVCEHWREPDHGIWEYRDQRRHYTHSRLMCWVALDRLLRLHERGQITRIDSARVRAERDALRQAIETENWNSAVGAYTQAANHDQVDASVLLLCFYNFEPATSDRLQQTHECVHQRLSPKPGLLWRDERSRTQHEGVFAFCSFWEVDFLARSNRFHEADALMKTTLRYANDLDLFAEQIDPESGDALGNFPQGFTHVGVINAALSLQSARERATKR
jgi:GH15 family glucan-1,4-alpha-glucosidase